MKVFLSSLIALQALLLLTTPLTATIRNVPDDFETIQSAVDAAETGDTVLVQPGTYYENVLIAKEITVGGLTLTTGDEAYISQTIIDGNRNYGYYGSPVTISEHTVSLIGFTIQNGTGYVMNDLSWGGGVFLWACRWSQLKHLVVQNNEAIQGGGICVFGGNPTFRNVLVMNNTGFYGGGVNLHFAASNFNSVTIANNRFGDFNLGDGASGGGVFSTASQSVFINTIIWGNEADETYLSASGRQGFPESLLTNYCDFEGGQNGNPSVIWGVGMINEDPDFVDANNGDFHLAEGSPCIDSGDPEAVPAEPDGSRADMGAYNRSGDRPDFVHHVPSEFETIQAAIDASNSRDTVLVAPGMYTENITIAKNIIVGSYTLTTGNIDYVGQTIIDGAMQGPVVYIENSSVKFRGFTVQNGLTDWYGGGIYCYASEVLLEDLIVWDNQSSGDGSGIAIYWDSHAEVRNVLVAYNTESGVEETGVFGVWAWSSADLTNVTIANNIPRYRTQAGIYLTQDAEITLNNCIVRNEGMVQMRLYPYWNYARATVTYSDFLGGAEAVDADGYGQGELNWGEGNIDEEANFRDAEGGDFRLADGSPCIDTGDPESPDDPDGSRVDMGSNLYGTRERDNRPGGYVVDRAQPDWFEVRTYGANNGHEDANSLIQTGDGGFVMAGSTTSEGAGGNDFWLLRTDAEGDSLWSRTYGGGGEEIAYEVIAASAGGFVIVGTTNSFGAGGLDFWVVRTDNEGEVIWSQTFGGEEDDGAQSVIQTGDGGFAIAGYTASFDGEGANYYDYWLVKVDENGEEIWSRNYGGEAPDVGFKLVGTTDGGFTLVGISASFGFGDYDAWMIHVDAQGDSLWAQRQGHGAPAGHGHYDYLSTLIQTRDGGYALAGVSGQAGGANGYLVRTNNRGELIWERALGNIEDWDIFHSLVEMEDGGFTIAGGSSPLYYDDRDFWLMRVDYLGECLWSRTLDISGGEVAKSLIVTADGGFALAGYVGIDGQYDFGLVYSGPEIEDHNGHQAVSAEPDPLDFGNIPLGESAIGYIVFSNNGNGNRQIRTRVNQSLFTTPDTMRLIEDGTIDSIEIIANEFGNNYPGAYEGFLLWTNECNEVDSIPIYANIVAGGGEPGVTVDEDTLDFGTIPDGQQAVRRLRFTNGGGTEIRIRARVVSGGEYYNCPEEEIVIPPGGSGYVSVIFNPGRGGGGGGVRPGELVWSAGGGGGEYPIPLRGGLGGGWGRWVETYGGPGGDGAGGIIPTNGGYFIGGTTIPADDPDYWGIGTGYNGRPVWTKTWGGPNPEKVKKPVKLRGGIGLIGDVDTTEENNGEPWLLVTEDDGDSTWSRKCGCRGRGKATGDDAAETESGEIIIVGTSDEDGNNEPEILVEKLSPEGEPVWTHTYEDGTAKGCNAVITLPGGDIVVVGTVISLEGDDTDALVIKLTDDGSPIWTKRFGGDGDETGVGIIPLPDGNFIVGTNIVIPNTRDGEIGLTQIDPDGDIVWSKTLGGPDTHTCNHLKPTEDGGFIIVGTVLPEGGNPDIFLIRTDETGDSLWSDTFGGNLPDYGKDVLPKPEGGFVVLGETESFGAGEADVVLFEINPDEGAADDITVSPEELDFGHVCIEEEEIRFVNFTNNGDRTVRLRTFIDHDEDFTTPEQVHTLPPTGQVDVPVTLRAIPSGSGGIYECHLEWYVTPDDVRSVHTIATVHENVPPTHFTSFLETDNNHSVLVVEATYNGEPIPAGWEVGVFTPDGLLAGASVKQTGLPLGLAVWGDDVETDEIDGFLEGEEMVFRLWDDTRNSEHSTDATPVQGELIWTIDGISAVTLTGILPRTLEVEMFAGWNLISVNVTPDSPFWICEGGPDVELMTSHLTLPDSAGNPVNQLILMKDEHGRFYWPDRDFNNIPYWSLKEGYQVKLRSALTGTWSGDPIRAGTPIHIESGWNMIAYLPSYTLPASSPDFEVISPILDNVIIAKDRRGNFLRPSHGFSNMAPWQEGQGYQIKVNADVTLRYPERRPDNAPPAPPEEENDLPAHWNAPLNTGRNMSVLIAVVEGVDTEPGDRIAIFSKTDGLQAGLGIVGDDGRCGLAVWGDDPSTVARDGFTEGEEFVLKLWKKDENREIDLNTTPSSPLPRYRTDDFESLSLKADSGVPTDFYLSQSYPNPFNSTTRIVFGLPVESNVRLTVYDLSGREAAVLAEGRRNAGYYQAVWSAGGQPAGVFFCRLETGSTSRTTKLLLVR